MKKNNKKLGKMVFYRKVREICGWGENVSQLDGSEFKKKCES